MTPEQDKLSRRELLKALTAMGGAAAASLLPEHWIEPRVGIGVLPAHAQSTATPPGGSQTFDYTGAPQNFVVPDGVTQLDVQAWGARGGNGLMGEGGLGGFIRTTLAVTPFETLHVYVGGRGENYYPG